MLHRLTIRDFVLVDRLDLEFATGFGALTGETGAGKSILVDALAFALGERADAGILRSGAERAEVSAEFDSSPAVAEWLQANDFATDEALLLRRLIDAGGRSRAYINGSPATLQQLREVAESLVDIHGQHAHQSLLRADAQRSLLDAHGGLDALCGEVAAAFRAWRAAAAARADAAGNAEALLAEREQLAWQLRELERLGFSADEWASLNGEHRRLAHASGLIDGVQAALALIADDDMGAGAGGDAPAALHQLDLAGERIDALLDVDPALAEVAGLLRSAQAELAEAASLLRRYVDRIDVDPQRLQEIERRIEATLDCARKYRVAPDELPALLASSRARLAELGEVADLAALDARVAAAAAHYEAVAARLGAARRATAEKLSADVSRVMQQLALAGGRFEVALLPLAAGSVHGSEQVEFRIAGLAGGEARALAKVASGGELSRISLAIQVVASQATRVPTLVFDEVDVGIGGGVAEVVGRLLRELGSERQVLCVTHLPQVAARALWQWRVLKESDGAGVRSRLLALDAAGRVEEIARMLGGVEITAITRQHAREMLAPGSAADGQ
ncbi:DNA repair protein RecN [Rhodocyclus tenuis]|uniref:DNA repair protein RecN n=1 Tax=Rhodocyclus tenuis TaxID=1066 RepID=A0A840GBW9_RHOTE|nr:DNA repair protein RecN [Rhodocyclus tenuis]MBB4248148.1 DNA repair protein RecN (Recombination protein N) [Rhodocyclus tenuis]